MWLSQTEKLIAPEGSTISASRTILVACCSLTGSPSLLMQAETAKFPDLCCLRIVSTDNGAMGFEWNVEVHLKYLYPCLGVLCN